MKKYIAVLAILIAIGAVLLFFTIKQNQKLDEQVYLQTTASIRNMKLLDNNLNALLFKARYDLQNNYDAITETDIGLSEEFDNLRYEALFEEIEASTTLRDAVANFEEQYLGKQEHIEEFQNYHSALLDASKQLPTLQESAITVLEDKPNATKLVNDLQINIYQFLRSGSTEQQNIIRAQLSSLELTRQQLNENVDIIGNYINAITTTLDTSERNEHFFTLAIEKPTGERLNDFEKAYANYHNNALEESNRLRNALIIYGLILLLVLLFFASLLRKNYANLEQQVAERTTEINKAYNDLKESQEQLIQSEKMASLGEMVAGVAHEINTPLGYVSSNVDTLKLNLEDMNELVSDIEKVYQAAVTPQRDNKKLSALASSMLKQYKQLETQDIIEESQQLIDDGQYGLNEISKLVLSLKDFARLDRQNTDQINIHECIDNALTIASNVLKEHGVTVKKSFSEELPTIMCMPSKLNQLFLNVINNAAQAMSNKENGQLNIISQQQGDAILLEFNDQGIGMDETTLQKMFDPFFTSKPIGEGTGLGMSIAYKIVQSHDGSIEAQSTPGVGTSIKISLPLAPSKLSTDSLPNEAKHVAA